jgi:hypothetical protein
MDYEYKEEGNAIEPVVAVFGGLVVLILVVVIGLVIAGVAWNTNYATISGLTDTNASGAIKTAVKNSFDAVSTSSTFIPLIVLAIIGGLAIYYVMGFMGGNNRDGRAM